MLMDHDYSKKRFLIIDDFENFQNILKRMLQSLNARDIDTARNGKQAIKLCEENKYDLIFCDFDLGKGKNGLQVFEEVRTRGIVKASTVFIMVTAESSKEAVIGTMEHKPDGYMTKPFSVGELKSRLKKIIKQKDQLLDIYNAIDKKDWGQVVKLCDTHIESDSRHKNFALKTKGECLLKAKKYEGAYKVYQSVLKSRKLNWAQVGLGHALAGLKKTPNALKAFETAYESNPANLEAYEGAAQMLVRMDKTHEAQKLLEQTETISGRSIKRAKLLANVCKLNDDFEGAAKASKSILKLAENTVHEKVENKLDLAENLALACETAEEKQIKQMSKEALALLQDVGASYKVGSVKTKAKLVEARAYSSLNNPAAAEKSIREAEQYIDAMGERTAPELKIELAKSYTKANQGDRAKKILEDVLAEHGDNPKYAGKIDELLDEPITKSGKTKVVAINHKGISLYKSNRFEEAADYFTRATRHYPKHIGIRLNIIQALLAACKQYGATEEKIRSCEKHVKEMGTIAKDHAQYKRYEAMIARVGALAKKLEKEQA